MIMAVIMSYWNSMDGRNGYRQWSQTLGYACAGEQIEGGLRPLRAVGATGWPPARSGMILRLGEKRPRREVGIERNAEM